MRALLLSLALLTLAPSCGTNYPVSTPTDPCRVVAWPEAPTVNPLECGECGELVCFSMEDTVALATWVHQVTEVRRSLDRCPLVVYHD